MRAEGEWRPFEGSREYVGDFIDESPVAVRRSQAEPYLVTSRIPADAPDGLVVVDDSTIQAMIGSEIVLAAPGRERTTTTVTDARVVDGDVMLTYELPASWIDMVDPPNTPKDPT